jgi:hypothetical protein
LFSSVLLDVLSINAQRPLLVNIGIAHGNDHWEAEIYIIMIYKACRPTANEPMGRIAKPLDRTARD